jgi:hypothetical protein
VPFLRMRTDVFLRRRYGFSGHLSTVRAKMSRKDPPKPSPFEHTFAPMWGRKSPSAGKKKDSRGPVSPHVPHNGPHSRRRTRKARTRTNYASSALSTLHAPRAAGCAHFLRLLILRFFARKARRVVSACGRGDLIIPFPRVQARRRRAFF